MKKTIVGMAMMAMALVGFNGMAQNTNQSPKAQTENSCCKQGDKAKKGGKMQAREKKNPYEGLNLTDAQKTKLADLDAKQQAKRQAAMEARKAQKDSKQKADKQNMTDAEKQAAKKAKMDARRTAKLEYLQEVKEIIGPDQYVVFLENIYVNGGQQGSGKAIKQAQKGQKGGRQAMAHNKDRKKGDRKGNSSDKSRKS